MRQPTCNRTSHQDLHNSGLRSSPTDNAKRLSNPVLWDAGLFTSIGNSKNIFKNIYNLADDRFMVAAAQFAFDMTLPTESKGSKFLAIPHRGLIWIRHLYEKAVGGFYSVVLSSDGWSVNAGKTIRWPVERMTSGIEKFCHRCGQMSFLTIRLQIDISIIPKLIHNCDQEG